MKRKILYSCIALALITLICYLRPMFESRVRIDNVSIKEISIDDNNVTLLYSPIVISAAAAPDNVDYKVTPDGDLLVFINYSKANGNGTNGMIKATIVDLSSALFRVRIEQSSNIERIILKDGIRSLVIWTRGKSREMELSGKLRKR